MGLGTGRPQLWKKRANRAIGFEAVIAQGQSWVVIRDRRRYSGVGPTWVPGLRFERRFPRGKSRGPTTRRTGKLTAFQGATLFRAGSG
jgi:hypothetical protein